MKRNGNIITRRDFLRTTTYATIATVLAKPGAVEGKPESDDRSRVVLVRHPDALDKKQNPNAKVIEHMLDDGIKSLLGTDDPVEAWRKLIKADDLVGIKSNVWAYMPTPKVVEGAIKDRVVDAGVGEDRIRIDDRGARKTLADCTALINARPLRTHHWAGIGGCLKNYIMFAWFPSRYHSDGCANLGHLWTQPIVKGKTRLNVLVVLRPLFHGRGSHHYSPKYLWEYKGILISSDPVALDAIGVRLLSAKRREYFGEDIPFPTRTHHVVYADTKHNVGISDSKRIDLIKVGWTEGALI